MAVKKNVQDALVSSELRKLHDALIGIMRVMNHPKRDVALMREAGIALDGALFPLLVGIERLGPIGVVDLADGVGRDYTTVSRQVAKLESLSLVQRQANAKDRRIREAVIAPKGQAMTDAIDAARNRLGHQIFETWDRQDFHDLVRLLQKFAFDIEGHTAGVGAGARENC